MDDVVRQLGTNGTPSPDIFALRVEHLALEHRIEYPEERRCIGAAACHPLPVERIVGGVRIDQRVAEPALALAPIDQQVLDQEGGGDHSDAIVHRAGLPELAHAGIDDRISCHPALPGVEILSAAAPPEAVEPAIEIDTVESRIVKERVPGEIAPDEFLAEARDIVSVRFERRGCAPDRVR